MIAKLEYTDKSYKTGEYSEKPKNYYKIFFGFETVTTELKKHMPYLCWNYNGDIQQELTGISQCAIDMLNALPTDNAEILLIAHTSDYDCRFILEYLQNVKPIVTSNRFLQVKATYYNPIAKKKFKLVVKRFLHMNPNTIKRFWQMFLTWC